MAEHDGSFISTLPEEERAGLDLQSFAASELNSLTGKNSEEGELTMDIPCIDTLQTDEDIQYVDNDDVDAYAGKRRHGLGDTHTVFSKKLSKTVRGGMFRSQHYINDALLSDDSLTELGITGFLPIDDDDLEGIPFDVEQSDIHLSNIYPSDIHPSDIHPSDVHLYPTPSPCHSRTAGSAFSSYHKLKTECQEILVTKHPEITKNRAITLFDSPENSQRGWSELGLRLRKPQHLKEPAHNTTARGEGFFNFIADEIVLSIFETMPKAILVKCARVCKRWKRLAYDESLWRRLDLGGRTLHEGVLGNCVLNRGVEYLRLSSAEVIGKVYTRHKLVKACKLQYLDMTMATVSVESLEELFSHCKHLKKVSLEGLPLNERICSFIGQNKSLTTLNFAMATGLSAGGLLKVFSGCLLLQELNLAWTKLGVHDVRIVASNLPSSLRYLNLSGCRENIDDTDVELLVNACPRLIDLDLSDSIGVTDLSLESIRTLADLQALHLSRCYYIEPHAFRSLKGMSMLHTLSIHSMMFEENIQAIDKALCTVKINQCKFSTVARPTIGVYRTSLWGQRVRDIPV